MVGEGFIRLAYYPFGSRTLSLSLPWKYGSDVWLIQRWLNRSLSWPGLARGEGLLPEDGVFSASVLRALRYLAKKMLFWQPWQVCDISYMVFGQDVGRFLERLPAFGSRYLGLGDKGHDVLVLQSRLVACGRRAAYVLGRTPDGVYDHRTARLVRIFQRDCRPAYPGVRATGHVTKDTLLALWDRTLLGGRTLEWGQRGLDVMLLQKLLSDGGYESERTGIFAESTRAACHAWQKERGLAATGSFGPAECWRLGLEQG